MDELCMCVSLIESRLSKVMMCSITQNSYRTHSYQSYRTHTEFISRHNMNELCMYCTIWKSSVCIFELCMYASRRESRLSKVKSSHICVGAPIVARTSHGTYKPAWDVSYICVSCVCVTCRRSRSSGACMSWHTCVMAHMSHTARVRNSCNTYAGVMSHTCHTYKWVMSHICHTYGRVMSHIWISHITHMDKSFHTYGWVLPSDESCRTCEDGTSRTSLRKRWSTS